MVALTPKGYWYSRRNRIDLLVTSAGILWVVLHFSLVRGTEDMTKAAQQQYEKNREFVDTLGYIVIILRFFTITGKHVSTDESDLNQPQIPTARSVRRE